MDLSGAKSYIINRLVKELPGKLTYHGAHHTFDVVKSAQEIGKLEKITNNEMVILLTASYYHDAGFLFTYHKNEPKAVALIHDVLPRFDYSEDEIKEIETIILATDINVEPMTLLEKIMCDADHDYFGREDYMKIANNLRKELVEFDVVYNDKEWLEVQIHFLERKHQFYTTTSIQERLPQKRKTVISLKQELEKLQKSQ